MRSVRGPHTELVLALSLLNMLKNSSVVVTAQKHDGDHYVRDLFFI